MLDAIKHFPCFGLICEKEAGEEEVSTPEADGGELAGHRGSWSQDAERDDWISDPKLSWSDRYPLGLVFAGDRGNVGEDQVVRGEVEGAVNLLTMASQGHIFNLGGGKRHVRNTIKYTRRLG